MPNLAPHRYQAVQSPQRRAVFGPLAQLAGLLCSAVGLFLIVAPELSTSLAQMLEPYAALRAQGGSLLTAGLIAFALGTMVRKLLALGAKLVEVQEERELLEQLAEEGQKANAELQTLRAATDALQQELVSLRGHVDQHAENQAREAAAARPHEPLFRLAASLDQLDARIDQRLAAQFDAVAKRIGAFAEDSAHATQALGNGVATLGEELAQRLDQRDLVITKRLEALHHLLESFGHALAEGVGSAESRLQAQLVEQHKSLQAGSELIFEATRETKGELARALELLGARVEALAAERNQRSEREIGSLERELVKLSRGLDAAGRELERTRTQCSGGFDRVAAEQAETAQKLGAELAAALELGAETTRALDARVEAQFAQLDERVTAELDAQRSAFTAKLDALAEASQHASRGISSSFEQASQRVAQQLRGLGDSTHARFELAAESTQQAKQELAAAIGQVGSSIERARSEHTSLLRDVHSLCENAGDVQRATAQRIDETDSQAERRTVAARDVLLRAFGEELTRLSRALEQHGERTSSALGALELRDDTRHVELRAQHDEAADRAARSLAELGERVDRVAASLELRLHDQRTGVRQDIERVIEIATDRARELSDALTLVESRLESEVRAQCASLNERLVEVGSLADTATAVVREWMHQTSAQAMATGDAAATESSPDAASAARNQSQAPGAPSTPTDRPSFGSYGSHATDAFNV